ncbi:hypothetical protein PspLS_03403 [Pyricularia sp. CBS 133598]|nr:hypothetical protein PspLS_03403 [Pyricularia sp. CBS 133598]
MMEAGYQKLAQLMGTQQELAMVRRFRALNMRNILYLQAEVTYLEEELQMLAARDYNNPNRRLYGKDWWFLANGEDPEDQDQWQKVLQIREKLDAYNDAILRQAQLAKLCRPTKKEVQSLRDWLEKPRMGNFDLLGLDRTSWEAGHESDLVSISPRPSDYFSRLFAESLVPLFFRLCGKRMQKSFSPDLGLYIFDDSSLSALLYGASTIVASVLPMLSVVALYAVRSEDLRLGLAVIFCACFALALVAVTDARRIEIFAATAAGMPISTPHEIHLSKEQHFKNTMERQPQLSVRAAEQAFPAYGTAPLVVHPRSGLPPHGYIPPPELYTLQQTQMLSALQQPPFVLLSPYAIYYPGSAMNTQWGGNRPQSAVLLNNLGSIQQMLREMPSTQRTSIQEAYPVVEMDNQRIDSQPKREPPKRGRAHIWIPNRFEEVPVILDSGLNYNWISERILIDHGLKHKQCASDSVSEFDSNHNPLKGNKMVEVIWREPSGKQTHRLEFFVANPSSGGPNEIILGDRTLRTFGERGFGAV